MSRPKSRPAVMDKQWKEGQPSRVIKIKRGGKGKEGNSGPVGSKLKPAAKMYRALADMAASHKKVKRG